MKKLLLILMFSILSFAETLNVGDTFPTITLDDQFEKTHTISLESNKVLVAYDKSMSTILKEFLLAKEDDFLTKNKTVYIGDISGMPSLISRFFAIPKMKKYPFSILFLDDKNRNAFSKKEDFISVYTLENGKVKTLTHVSSKEELENLFK
ncbi:hypothetical protein A9Q76_04290 [Arcobacter sp. 31_11_sub10_T18]|nr:hypothetical protein A9Q76_04290 [Arcobacter sp. 31_11_sub10_T18]